jgi:hypothetical protein
VSARCCGDLTCEQGEDGYNCAVDCGAPPVCGDGACEVGEGCGRCAADCATTELCTDGIDNDCDAAIDCSDPDCADAAACQVQCVPLGGACANDRDCCSNDCHGRRNTCR